MDLCNMHILDSGIAFLRNPRDNCTTFPTINPNNQTAVSKPPNHTYLHMSPACAKTAPNSPSELCPASDTPQGACDKPIASYSPCALRSAVSLIQ